MGVALRNKCFEYCGSGRAIASLALGIFMAGTVGVLAADDAEVKLTPEEAAEREGRKACKIKICSVFRLKQPGDDVACKVVKSWRKEQLTKKVKKARVSWPWGKVTCQADIKLPREQMIKSMTEAKFEMNLEKHSVTCMVAREKEPAKIKFSFQPKVSFQGGKAVKASLNWGKIEAPTLVKGAMWTATATDNTFNVLESSIVKDINKFLTAKCDEVKDELK